jgi:RNA polymerase sigma factor (sigma-70 family)
MNMNQTIQLKQQETELKALYKKWPDIRMFLLTLGCSKDVAEDIFQEALIIFCRKKQTPEFLLEVEPFFYVRNTCKLLWYNEFRKSNKQATYELTQDIVDLKDDWFEREMKFKSMESTLERLGKKCREILHLFYGLGWTMTDIAYKIGLRNDKVVKAQKYRCIQDAKLMVSKIDDAVLNQQN